MIRAREKPSVYPHVPSRTRGSPRHSAPEHDSTDWTLPTPQPTHQGRGFAASSDFSSQQAADNGDILFSRASEEQRDTRHYFGPLVCSKTNVTSLQQGSEPPSCASQGGSRSLSNLPAADVFPRHRRAAPSTARRAQGCCQLPPKMVFFPVEDSSSSQEQPSFGWGCCPALHPRWFGSHQPGLATSTLVWGLPQGLLCSAVAGEKMGCGEGRSRGLWFGD